MLEYAKEKNIFECTCMGARNKMVLKSAILFEKARFEQLHVSLERERESVSALPQDTEFSYNYKVSRINDIDKLLKATSDDVLLAGNLFNKISTINICGD